MIDVGLDDLLDSGIDVYYAVSSVNENFIELQEDAKGIGRTT